MCSVAEGVKSGRNIPSGQKDSSRGGWHFLGQGIGLQGPNPGAQTWAGCGPRVERGRGGGRWGVGRDGAREIEFPSRHSDGAGSRQL